MAYKRLTAGMTKGSGMKRGKKSHLRKLKTHNRGHGR
jgi:hypothetical protein